MIDQHWVQQYFVKIQEVIEDHKVTWIIVLVMQNRTKDLRVFEVGTQRGTIRYFRDMRLAMSYMIENCPNATKHLIEFGDGRIFELKPIPLETEQVIQDD